jgi:two-component system phosphate regulon sensor histidine kinase PhoR
VSALPRGEVVRLALAMPVTLYLATLGTSWALLAVTGLLSWLLIDRFYAHRLLLALGGEDGAVQNGAVFRGLWRPLGSAALRAQRRERKRKRQLDRARARFLEFTEAVPDGALLLDEQFRLLWWNSAAARRFHLESPAHQGLDFDALLPDVPLRDLAHRGEIGSLRVDNHASGRLLELRVVRSSKRKHLLLVRDVTELEEVDRMRRDFVSNVSHELRTPLTVLSGYQEMMSSDQPPAGDELRSILESMGQQTLRMRRLVEDLLLLSRLESERTLQSPQPVALGPLLGRLREDARTLSGDSRHEVLLECETGLTLLGSEAELASAFANVVFNAVHYTPSGGRITIRARRAGQGAAVIQVSDTGIGIPAEHLPRVTERFYRVDVSRSRATGGTGLGLAIVKHALTRHQAALEILSREGQGTVVSMRFPPLRVVHEPVGVIPQKAPRLCEIPQPAA